MIKYFSFCIYILVAVVCLFSTPARATVYKQINFEWEYDTSVEGLAGYILYQGGKHLHTIRDPKALSVDLNVGLEPGSVVAFTMKAFDVEGNESALSAPYNLVVPVAFENSNFLPIPMISNNINNTTVDFTALGSTDFDGDITSYSWNFGDGTYSTYPSVTHIFSVSGTYIVILTVTDNDGGIVSCNKEIIVNNTEYLIKRPINIKLISN